MINVWFWHTLISAMAITAGYRIAKRAWRKLRRLQISIELLVTVAITGALLLGEFTEAGAVAVLFILGEQLEAHALRRTRLALSNLVDLLPEKATILKDGAPVEVAPDELRTGDVLLVREGARVPADGKVVKGQAAVDESPITGESLPVEKFAGSTVFAGSISRNGALWLRADRVGGETILARMYAGLKALKERRLRSNDSSTASPAGTRRRLGCWRSWHFSLRTVWKLRSRYS